MKKALKTLAIASSTFVCAALFSLGWSEQGNLSLSISKADAQARVYIHSHYAASSHYVEAEGLPWYAVRAYYHGGPYSGPGFSYATWDDYASHNGIVCHPGTAVQGKDGIMYNCQ